ncbi:hypothetical protein OsJ_04450 [Oryza sativa Japonica Group]|uniref:Uncharacterized protein n=1 Tax=Oryza sativa subsp. japonica TaxID=39947 RepID=B9EVF4_ORYSJ|nr:hypothetical protein OsJ_04450 [Oryza sativa Japonica Group]
MDKFSSSYQPSWPPAQATVDVVGSVETRQRCRPARRAFQRVASFFVQELLDRRASAGAGPCEHGVLHPAVVVREAYAEGLGMYLEFRGINRGLESLHIDDLGVDADEAVAINSVLELHSVVKESRGALNSVLQTIRKLSPRAFVLVEQDAGHNAPFFLGRFMEALHYYAALFDALDAALPRYDARRARVEQFHFGAEIRNVVGCEGAARVERHERADQWRRRMSRAGFQSVPIKMAAKAREWLDENAGGDGYTVADEKVCLVLGWKGKPVIAASCWKC